MSTNTNSIFDLFSNNAQLNAANTIQGRPGPPGIGTGILGGESQALPYYQQGIDALRQYGGGALNTLQSNLGQITPGVDQLKTMLGLGPGGMRGALSALRGTPGYGFAEQQGNAAIEADAARTGGTGGGNVKLALSRFNQGLADTTYNNYISQLQPFLPALQNVGGQIAGTAMDLGRGVMGGLGNIGNMFYGGATSAANALAAAQANTSGASNLFNLGMSGLAGLGGYLLSDFKLKEDIQPVGALASGETVYRYHFKGDPTTHIGLIAQEVEGATPEAVIELLPDLRAVDYRRATDKAAKILEFSREHYEPTPTHRPFASELMELAA